MKLFSPVGLILIAVVAYLAYQQGYSASTAANLLAASQYPALPGGGV